MSRLSIVVLGMIFTALAFIACETGQPVGEGPPWYVGSWGTRVEGLAGSRLIEVTISEDRRVFMLSRLPSGQIESQGAGWVESDFQIRMDDGVVIEFRGVGDGLEMLDPTTGQRRAYQRIEFVGVEPGPGGPGPGYEPAPPVRAISFDRGLIGHWEGYAQRRGPDARLRLEINGNGSVELRVWREGHSHTRKRNGYLAEEGQMIVFYGGASLWVRRHRGRLETHDPSRDEFVEYTRVRN